MKDTQDHDLFAFANVDHEMSSDDGTAHFASEVRPKRVSLRMLGKRPLQRIDRVPERAGGVEAPDFREKDDNRPEIFPRRA